MTFTVNDTTNPTTNSATAYFGRLTLFFHHDHSYPLRDTFLVSLHLYNDFTQGTLQQYLDIFIGRKIMREKLFRILFAAVSKIFIPS